MNFINMLTVFTVWKTIFQKEWTVAKEFAAVCTVKAFRVKLSANRIQTILWLIKLYQ